MKEKLNENIVKILLENENYVTAKEFAITLGVNEKTIRRRIKQINEGLLESVGKIVSKRGDGFKLIINNKEEFNKYYNYSISEVDMNTLSNRRTAIFEELVYNKYTLKEDLQEKFYISETTLSHDIKALNNYVSKVGVSIKLSKKGYYVDGDEYHIRNIILRLIYDSGAVKVRRRDTVHDKKWVVDEVRQVFYKMGFYINKHSLDAIVNYLLISEGNLSRGRVLHVTKNINYSQIGDKFIILASDLHNTLSKVMNTTFPYNETVFLAYFLKSILPLEMINPEESSELYYLKSKELTSLAFKVMGEIGIGVDININCENDFRKFFYSFYMRVDLNIQKRYHVYEKIEMTYPHSYCVSKIIFAEIEKLLETPISKEEIAYFSLIMNYFYFYKDYTRIKVLAILPSDYTISRIYKRDLKNTIISDLEFIEFAELQQKDLSFFNDYTLLVNPFDKIIEIENIKRVNISEVVTSDDIKRILRILSYRDYDRMIKNLKNTIFENCTWDFENIEYILSNEKNMYFTTYLNSYICFKNLNVNTPMKYMIFEKNDKKNLIIFINTNLSSNEIVDLLKVATNSIILLRESGKMQKLEQLLNYYV